MYKVRGLKNPKLRFVATAGWPYLSGGDLVVSTPCHVATVEI